MVQGWLGDSKPHRYFGNRMTAFCYLFNCTQFEFIRESLPAHKTPFDTLSLRLQGVYCFEGDSIRYPGFIGSADGEFTVQEIGRNR